MTDVRTAVLTAVDAAGSCNSRELAGRLGVEHEQVVGVLKSLEALEAIKAEISEKQVLTLSEEGVKYARDGSPEYQVWKLVASSPLPQPDIDNRLGDVAKVGFGAAMKNKWVSLDKATKMVSSTTEMATDSVGASLKLIEKDGSSDFDGIMAKMPKEITEMKKRKLVLQNKISTFTVTKGEKFALDVKKAAAEITAEMIATGAWKQTEFKPYNMKALGMDIGAGNLHPLHKVKTEIRQILLLMGFQEMKTNQFVESSFWNFDVLYQPQQHPARDAHDTFFIKEPSRTGEGKLPREYVERVRTMHEKGGNGGWGETKTKGSTGWGYVWDEDEARKTILRTHTTAVSSRTLYEMGQEYQKTKVWVPRKCFSTDRVFRNETLDATHLAEFHQVEGFIADKGLSIGHLIGLFKEFFARIGISNLKFKPAYNPYTEPSMEIFGYHPGLKKWIEIGNSGVFRPEMLLPMGLPEDVRVIAWGLSVERPTMLLYGISNIRELFGAKMDVQNHKVNPVAWYRDARRTDDKAAEKTERWLPGS